MEDELILFNKSLKSTALRLIAPKTIREEILEIELKPGYVAVEPTLVSVCHADTRYYTGHRRKEALKSKLPMALFHEGIGMVVESNDTEFRLGERVVIIPNIPRYVLDQKSKSECCNSCASGNPDNYCEEGVFLGSGYDGIGQSRLILPSANLLTVPENIPDNIGVLTELCSVSLHAINQLSELEVTSKKIAIFGDGPVGFLTAAMLHFYFKVPKERLIVFGAQKSKLKQFDFATKNLIHDFDFSENLDIDIVFECTGGNFSESAINQAIELINRKGRLILLGVTEKKVPINTRDVLEKGIKISGSSRSGYTEFKLLMDILQNKELQDKLMKLVSNSSINVNNVNDLTDALDYVEQSKSWQKLILSFNWKCI